MVDITVKNLTKKFGDFAALRGLDLTFPAGRVTCLLGPSGCGKTTLMRIIAGLETPTTGDIYFGNERVNELSTRQRNIGMVFQYPVVYRGISVRENIELPLSEDRSLSKSERMRRVEEVLDILEMRDVANMDVSELDNGTRQKVACAREVARRPKIILFDEPITNVDINSKLQLKRGLKELFVNLKQTVIYVTHDQTEAMTLADQIALMKDGLITQIGSPREVYDHPKDAFAGFFLGNPGMNFYENVTVRQGEVICDIFPSPMRLPSLNGAVERVVLGIRPEYVRIVTAQTPAAVRAKVIGSAIVTGGQYLLRLKVGSLTVRAKTSHAIGSALQVGDELWAEFPIEHVSVFANNEEQLSTERRH
jgi:ABC-type sugar transport system ATPase subunit